VRALGAAGVAAAFVVIAAAVAYPSVNEALNPLTAPACTPLPDDSDDWWEQGIAGGDFLSGFGGAVRVELSAERLLISRDGEGSVEIPLTDHLLEGTSEQGETLQVEMPDGTLVEVALTWTEGAVTLSYGLAGSDNIATASVGPMAGVDVDMQQRLDPQYRYWTYRDEGLPASTEMWILADIIAGRDALSIDFTDPQAAIVTFPDGSTQIVDAGDDGYLTFEWVDVTTIQLGVTSSSYAAVGDLVDAPVDERIVGPEWCLPDWATVSPEASASASAAS